MKDEGKREPAQLALDFFNWLERGMYHSGGAHGAIYFSENSVDRKKNLVQLTRDSIEYIIGFTSGSDPQNTENLFVLTPGSRNLVDTEAALSECKLTKDYTKIFGNERPKLKEEKVQFGEKEYLGIKVEARIIRIPFGKNGGLSETLFRSIKENILIPLHKK